jgi:hypothetical protein
MRIPSIRLLPRPATQPTPVAFVVLSVTPAAESAVEHEADPESHATEIRLLWDITARPNCWRCI